MRRDIEPLNRKTYDLVIVGAGIFGACAAWDAARRGLSVALIEKSDFCQATSAHHFKMIHGGMRYLQHLDLKRVRESCLERSILLRIAPHLAHPLPILMPTYGHGMKGKALLKAGLILYDLLTLDRNRHIEDPNRKLPASTFLSRDEVLSEFPGTDPERLTGGVVFYDGQIYNPTRLALSFIRSAVRAGADAANYLEADSLLKTGDQVVGMVVRDILNGDKLEIRCRCVLNTAGPWAHIINEKFTGKPQSFIPSFSRDLILVVSKKLARRYAFAALVKSRDKDALFDRGGRHLFIVPWREYSLIGVWHKFFRSSPENISISVRELNEFLYEINHVYEGIDLTLDDVGLVNTGLILFGTEGSQGGNLNHSFAKRSILIDHSVEDRISGLFTLIGVRATVARKDAKRVLDLITNRLALKTKESETHKVPVYGGEIHDFNKLVEEVSARNKEIVSKGAIESLIRNYGSEYDAVLKFIDENPAWANTIGNSTVLMAEVIHAVREEMACKLEDVVFRRTELGTGSDPGIDALRICGALMAQELGWKHQRTENEIREVAGIFSRRGPWAIR